MVVDLKESRKKIDSEKLTACMRESRQSASVPL